MNILGLGKVGEIFYLAPFSTGLPSHSPTYVFPSMQQKERQNSYLPSNLKRANKNVNQSAKINHSIWWEWAEWI